MENTLSKQADTNTEMIKAEQLHSRIKANIAVASMALVDMCKDLKEMRDGKHFASLGYESFEDYTTKALGFKARQAYNYIRAYENLGQPFLQSNADWGVTKLSLLVDIPALEREEFAEKHDIGGMSVSELKKLVEENNRKGEQLTLLTNDLADKDSLIVDKTKELTAAQARIKELTNELEAERSKPITATPVGTPDKESIEKIKKEQEKVLDREKKKLEKEYSKKVADQNQAFEKEKAELKKEMEEAEAKLEKQKAKLEERISELEKESSISKKAAAATDEESRFKVYFEELQNTYNSLIESLEKIKNSNSESGEKYHMAIKKFLTMMVDRME